MRRVGRIAQQHDVATRPRLDADGRELTPHAAIGDQAMTIELLGKQLLEECGGAILVRFIHPRRSPRLVPALDDEGRLIGCVLISVHPPQTVRAMPEVKGEGRKRLGRPEPDESIRPEINGLTDPISEELANRTVDAVGPDDEIGISTFGKRWHFALKLDPNARGGRLLLQRSQQRMAADAAEAVAGRGEDFAAVVD